MFVKGLHCGLYALLLVGFCGAIPEKVQAQPIDEEQALERLDSFFPGKLISNPLRVDWRVDGSVFARTRRVDATSIPGQSAFEIAVRQARANDWEVALVTPLGNSIQRGDVVLMAFWARAAAYNEENGTAQTFVRLARNKEPYDHIISQKINVTDEWRLYFLKSRAPIGMKQNDLEVSFQVGKQTQTLQFGQFYVTNSGPDGDYSSLLSGSQDLEGNFQPDFATGVERQPDAPVVLPGLPPAGPEYHPTDAGWSVVWSDEFKGENLDTDKWLPEVSCWGGGNNERQCYTARPENVRVANDQLLLIARGEVVQGPNYPPEFNQPNELETKPYSSGKVRTRNLADWRYGRFEVRAKLPSGQGVWPAFWMLPSEDHYGTWPYSGEIDIMEAVNLGAKCDECDGSVGENRSLAALHFSGVGGGHEFVEHRTTLADKANPADDYHVWAAEWAEGHIQFFLDGRKYASFQSGDWSTDSEKARGNKYAPFDRNFYLMLNLAIGGVLPESQNEMGVAPDLTPAIFAIDWVRVYQCAEDPQTGRACLHP